jgi:hypothetical protein
MSLSRLRARLARLGTPPEEPTPASMEEDLARARVLELGFRESSLRGPPLTEEEKAELAELEGRFPPDLHDPLAGAIKAWRAATSNRS